MPVDGDLSRADAKEASKIDNGGPHHAGAVNDDVDNAA